MNLPTPVMLTHEWRFVPTLQLFAGDAALPVCHGFLLYKQDGFEFTAAFQIEHFVVVCERKRGGTWFMCMFAANQHYTIAPISSSTDMCGLMVNFVLHRLKTIGIDKDTRDLAFRPLNQGTILQQLTPLIADGFRG
jgi:hypothetical protein